MPNGGKGAIAKIYVETEVIDNFKQQAAKIKSGLGNGLKDLKDLDLKFGFDEKSMAEAASKELDAMMNTMTSKKLNKLDFSGIVPNMISYLNDDKVADTVKLQIVQGLRQGLESFSSLASSVDIDTLARRDTKTVFSNILGYTAVQDILGSFDFTKQKSNLINKQFNTTMGLSVGRNTEGFAQDVAQLLSLKATYDDPRYKEVAPYLISGTYRKKDKNGDYKDVSLFKLQALSELLDPYVMQKRGEEGTLTPKVVEDIAGYLERMKYLGEAIQLKAKEGDPINDILDQYNSIVEDKNYSKFIEYIGNDPKLSAIFNDTRKKVAEASRYKDVQYAQIDWHSFSTDINDVLARLITGTGTGDVTSKLLSMIKGWEGDKKQFTADELLAETIKSFGVRSEDNGLRAEHDYAEQAEKAAGRAEQAANKAEAARDKAQEIANNISDKLEEIGDANSNNQNNASASQGQDGSGSSDDKPSTEGAATRAEGVAEEGDAIVEGLQHEEEDLDKATEKIREEHERVEQARENFNKEINNSKQGKTQPSTSATTSQPDTVPQEEGGQTESEVDVAREKTGEVQKSRIDLEDERNKLQDEIRKSGQTMSDAENRMAEIDRDIEQTQQTKQRNSDTIDRLTEKQAQIESQIQQTKDELKTIKERLQDAVDAKQAAEEEIRALEEKLLNADGSDIISADSTENLDKYNQLKEEKYSANFDLDISRRVLETQEQKQKEIEEILNGEYSTKTLQEAYKQAMARKKQYLQLQEEYEKMPAATDMFGIDEIGSADFMLAVAKQRDAGMEVDKAWMSYYKAFQEFESHGRGDSGNKKAMRDRLLSGIDGHNLPTDTSFAAETIPDTLKEELISLNEQIEYDKKEVEEAQKKVDELQQQLDELASHLVTTDNVSKQLEQKRQEQQKFEQEESTWTAQQDTKQAELDNLNERLNGTRGVANYLKAVQDGQQNNQEELAQLQQQRAEQQCIYDEAKAIQEEKARQLEELDKLIAETEAREPTMPTTAQEKPVTSSESPLSSSGGQTADDIQQEGNEADDAASKMKALADAKKEALEANRQLAESANATQEAISAESSAGDFNTLILALTEIYELLSQLPQSFEGFKGFDLTGFTEPLNSLSQVIQQLPKEGFNISLGDSFDNLANRINEVLQKIQELTSQAKTAEIESNIAEKYDGQIKQLNEQINQLRTDADEAKKALEELKKTQQDVGQTTSIKKEEKQIDPLSQIDKQLAKEYDNLYYAQDKLFTTTNVSEYNSALENVENTLQRIRQLEQDIASQYAGQSQTDYLLMGYGDDPIDTLSNRLPESTKARNEAQSSTRQLAKEYIEQQKAEIETLVDSLKTINIIPEDTQSNWSKKRRDEYTQITEGAQAASQAIDMLNASLESMETNGANSAILKNFLELKESTAQMAKDVQDKNNVFGNDIQTASAKLIERLSNVEERLQIIKRDSGKLINIDPALAGALATIEKHLNKIHDLKNTVSKDPLQAINPQFTRSANSYLAQMEGKGKSKSVVEGLEQTSARSQTDLKRMTTNYNSYATALKKLFDDMSKGAGVSLKQLEEDLGRVNELATKLANSTGLERNNLLTGELNPKADPKIADVQAGAANKVAVAYEAMYTKIESKAKAAQSTIEGIFGAEGIAKGLDTKFVEGNVEGFDSFVQNANQAGESLKRLKEIQNSIEDDKNWITQKENIKEYQQTVETLNKSLEQVAENASKFSAVDELDVQKLRASTIQFIRDNPALSGEDISQLEGYINQLQDKINSTDFTAIKNGIEGVKQTAIEAGRTGDTFFSMLTQRFKSLGAYLLSFVSFYRVIGVFKDGINIIHELDDALTEMQKVSDESLSSLREYQKGTFDTANQIGTTAAQLQQSTADWMRLGEDLQTASQSAQTANVLLNVSEFDSINEATTSLVAMSAAYADAEKDIDKMDIVDRLNLIGNNYAIATDELATALQDGAAALQTAGNDLDQAIALTTAGNIKIA